jgi:hypothetical protein
MRRYVTINEKSIGEFCSQFIFSKSVRTGTMNGSVIAYRKFVNVPPPITNQESIALSSIAN